jgi:hypothetical protein
MSQNWLWQGLVANWLSSLLLLAAGGIVTYLRRVNSQWVIPALYGLGGAALMAIILFFSAGIVPQQAQVNSENAESKTKQWLGDLGIANTLVPDTSAIFALEITMQSGKTMVVRQLNKIAGHVDLYANVADNDPRIQALSDPKKKALAHDLTIELAHSGFIYELHANPVLHWRLEAYIPINDKLTEDLLRESLSKMDMEIIASEEVLGKTLDAP